jgi:hypothetical protein
MELKEFISETLIQIADGIQEGHKYICDKNKGGGVNDTRLITIRFDVAVTILDEEKSGISGKIGIVNLISAGGDNGNTSSNTKYSRIEFSLPVSFRTTVK